MTAIINFPVSKVTRIRTYSRVTYQNKKEDRQLD